MLPTPEPPACTSTSSQGCSLACVMRQCHDVCSAMGNAAASAKDISSGMV